MLPTNLIFLLPMALPLISPISAQQAPQMVMRCTDPFDPIYRTCPGVRGASDQVITAQTCGDLCWCKNALGKPLDIDCRKEGVAGTACSALDLVRTCKCGVAKDAYDTDSCGQPCWCEEIPPR